LRSELWTVVEERALGRWLRSEPCERLETTRPVGDGFETGPSGGPLNHRRGAQVFAFFTDPSHEPQWRGQVKEIRAEGPPAVVARIDRVAMGQTESGSPPT
jgi:hypothetical protein